MLSVFVCTDHDYHWPVGVASIVVASSETAARSMLSAALAQRGLDGAQPFTLTKVNMDAPMALVLCDGNY